MAATAVKIERAAHIYAPTTPRTFGAPTAKPERRYVGKYYWCNYWGHWDKVIDVDPESGRFQVAKCDSKGNVIEKPRWHSTPMPACLFADRPFSVTRH